MTERQWFDAMATHNLLPDFKINFRAMTNAMSKSNALIMTLPWVAGNGAI